MNKQKEAIVSTIKSDFEEALKRVLDIQRNDRDDLKASGVIGVMSGRLLCIGDHIPELKDVTDRLSGALDATYQQLPINSEYCREHGGGWTCQHQDCKQGTRDAEGR